MALNFVNILIFSVLLNFTMLIKPETLGTNDDRSKSIYPYLLRTLLIKIIKWNLESRQWFIYSYIVNSNRLGSALYNATRQPEYICRTKDCNSACYNVKNEWGRCRFNRCICRPVIFGYPLNHSLSGITGIRPLLNNISHIISQG